MHHSDPLWSIYSTWYTNASRVSGVSMHHEDKWMRCVKPHIVLNPLMTAWCLNALCPWSSWYMNAALMSNSTVLHASVMPTLWGWDTPEGSSWCTNAAPASYSLGLNWCIMRQMSSFSDMPSLKVSRVNFTVWGSGSWWEEQRAIRWGTDFLSVCLYRDTFRNRLIKSTGRAWLTL